MTEVEALKNIKVTEVSTPLGLQRIEVNGFFYNLQEFIANTYVHYWICEFNTEYKCNARVKTVKINQRHIVRSITRDHNHHRRENATQVKALIALRDLKVSEIKDSPVRTRIEINGFYYRRDSSVRIGSYYWKCVLKNKHKCNARAITFKENDRHIVRSITRDHNHEQNENTSLAHMKALILLRDLEVTEMISLRGRPKIEVGGYRYNLKERVNDAYYWVCELLRVLEKCSARVTTDKGDDGHVVRSLFGDHNHYPPTENILRYRPEELIITPTGKDEAPNRVQLIRLVEALKLNPEVAKGICPKALKRKKFKDFSIELNALGPPQNKWNEWFKVWTHWKKELLQKSVCPPARRFNPNVHLTALEQTVIQLIYSSQVQTQVSEFEPDELLYEEESDLNSGSDEDEVEIIEIDDDEESFDISKEPFDPSALANNEAFSSSSDGFEDSQSWQNEPTSSTNVQPENSDTLALHEIKSEEEEVVEQNIQRYDSSESLEGHVEEFLNMKDELQTIKNCHQKILQDQISVEKDFHSKVMNFMGEIKTSMENIESHLKINLERNDALIALKKEKVEAYRQAKEDKLADKQAKLQLQFQLFDSKKRKLDNLMVKKES